jgi:hypothetical protein
MFSEQWEAHDDSAGAVAERDLAMREAEAELDAFVTDAAGAAALRRAGRSGRSASPSSSIRCAGSLRASARRTTAAD